MRIRKTCITVSGARVMHPLEIGVNSLCAIRIDGIDRSRNGPRFSSFHIQNARDVRIAFTIILNHFGFAAGKPLQHATLLSAPRARFAEIDAAVAIVRINHPDANHVGFLRRATLKRKLRSRECIDRMDRTAICRSSRTNET